MNEGDATSFAIIGFCALMSVPGIVIAFRHSARRGIVVNLVIYLMVGTALVLLTFLQNKLDHGTWGPKTWPFMQLGYTLFGVAGIGIWCFFIQVIAIPVATMLRRRRQGRKPRGLEPKSAANGGHRE